MCIHMHTHIHVTCTYSAIPENKQENGYTYLYTAPDSNLFDLTLSTTRDEDCFHGFPRAVSTVNDQVTQTLHYSNVSGDCSGEPMKVILISVTELFTVFSTREWLFGIWTNINCSSQYDQYTVPMLP